MMLKHQLLLFATMTLTIACLHGQHIYYSSEKGSRGRDIYKLSINDKLEEKLTQHLGNGHYPHHINPKISPDGKKIVFQSDPDGHDKYTIWIMNTDRSNIKQLTHNEGMYPNWSPDGSQIVFSGRRNGIWEILLIPSDGGSERNISNYAKKGLHPGWGAMGSFSPDGEKFIFTHIRDKELIQLDLKTETMTNMGQSGASYLHPMYSSDGRIAVNKKLSSGYDLVIMDNSGDEKIIVKNVISYSSPAWSSDGKKLLFCGMVNGSQEIFEFNLETGMEVQVTNNSIFDAMPTWK